MFYWVIYDISSNKTRNKIASKCKNYGMRRIQKSAFAGELTRNKSEMLSQEVKEVITESTDCVFIMPTCEQCFKCKEIVGHLDEESIRKKDFIIIGKNEPN